MEIVGRPDEIPTCSARCRPRSTRPRAAPGPWASVERFAFYERARQAYAVIDTGERRFYGCFIFKKGVIPPP